MNKLPSTPAKRGPKLPALQVLALASLLGLAGCTPKYVGMNGCPPKVCAPQSYVVLIPSPDGSIGQVVVKGQQNEQVLSAANQTVAADGTSLAVDEQQVKRDFAEARAAQPKIPVRQVLQFTSGTTLAASSEGLIAEIIAEAQARPAVDVSVIGHADTLNSSEYNDKLALKRATMVADLLKERGLKANSLTVESHGKRNLLVQTPDNTFEPKNRRVEVSIR